MAREVYECLCCTGDLGQLVSRNDNVQGKFADLVILESDPRRVAPDSIKDIGVVETWMNGEQVFSAPASVPAPTSSPSEASLSDQTQEG